MANSLPWSVKGVDPRTRDAAKAAARRAGMTLGEWLDHKIRDESDEAQPGPTFSAPPEQLDIAALSQRLAQLSQGRTDTASRVAPANPPQSQIDALVRQAATAEKLTRETSTRTAGALDSIARWIEQAEDRMASGERAAAERQERATNVIAEAIKTMGERIVEIERRAGEAQQQAGERSPRLAFSRDGLAAAVTDIRTRQRLLDREEDAPSQPAQDRISALREDLRGLGARLSPDARTTAAPKRPVAPFGNDLAQALEAKIAALGDRLDKLAGHDHFEPVLKPLARLEAEVSRLSRDRAGDDYQHVQHEIAHLASKIDALSSGTPAVDLAPLARDMADLRSLVAKSGNDHRLEELSQQIAMLGFELGRLRETQPDMREMRNLSAAIDDVRGAVLADRSRTHDQGALSTLAGQIDRLSQKFDAITEQRPAEQLDHRIDALQQHIERLAEQSPVAVIHQIETLAGRIESIAASSEFARMAESRQAAADLSPIEDMLRHLAAKIDEAGTPGANSDSFEALEQQISGIAARLDEAAATRTAESGIERTLQDLVVHLRSMRDETAAERAALAQATHSATPGKGITELSSLVSGLRDTHISTERQTQDALGALNQTLEAIMGRLSNLEGELLADRKAPVTARPAAQRAPAAGTRQEPAMRPATPQPREPLAAAAPALPQERPASGSDAPGRTEPTLALPSSAFDLPLEPGSGRPRPEASAVAGQDPQSVRQSLIAAARRSARAASEAAATPAPATEPSAKSPGRLREIMEKRKRPLLLGLAALILALGTAQVVTSTLRKDTKTVNNQSRSLTASPAASPDAPAAQPQATPTEAAPAKDQSSAAPAPTAPATNTAAASDTEAGKPAAAPEAKASAPAAPEAAADGQSAPSEAIQTVTGLGDLPTGLGSAGLRKAALDGDARAVYELASRAADGPAGSRDAKLALRLFERAAVAGLAPAQFRLGNMFEKGVGAPRDLSLARIWYQRAAERGNAKAMHNLAVLSAEGASGKPDYATATTWFAKAAELGVRDSQYNLAVLLGRGLGAPTDLAQSYVWFAVAAGQGDEDAARKRDEVAQRLKPDDLAAAKARATGWKPKPLDAAANEVTPPAKGWDAGPTATTAKPGKPSRS
jgi:localization factor PodJL